MKKALSEFAGTYLLVFIGTGSVIFHDLISPIGTFGIALAFGLAVALGVKLFGNISGAHMNPAVSISFFYNKHLTFKELINYIIAQFLGALLASLTLHFLFPTHQTLGLTVPKIGLLNTFLLETLLTFILVLGIYLFRDSKWSKYTGYAAAVIVLFEAYLAGPLTGASMNPARSFAPALISGHLDAIIIYLIAPVFGGLLSLKICSNFSTKTPCCSSGSC